ncbi:MAG: phosphoheptose isomerase [Bacteroidetes bacterium]|nr:phosphoheptose isomerase [Bacteroidota bacterium]MBP7400553.1 hypothetical protein [Chitinophagales bacterium]MBK7108593.1 phosphoheptose isomerase [Bacteroidota bacterium]MBK8489081.1 phosphoheptose isomerase [Bacteroidota bacterium]MBK8680930.1 phosphoheptose isomerase [Bacteroidota bacterium]
MENIFINTAALLQSLHFNIVNEDCHRPWGGFFVIDDSQAEKFAKHFFPEENFNTLQNAGKLSPKILMVAPGKRLSWQYHNRRSEIWRCVDGDVAVAFSDTDKELHQRILKSGDIISLPKGKRHRLIGLNNWGVVAEIWQHTNESQPSDEEDIVRLQDDFGR